MYSPFVQTKVLDFPSAIPWLLLMEILSHSDYVPVYADASKSQDGAGCAAVFPNTILRGSLSSFASIYIVELLATYLALQFILNLSKPFLPFLVTPAVLLLE